MPAAERRSMGLLALPALLLAQLGSLHEITVVIKKVVWRHVHRSRRRVVAVRSVRRHNERGKG